MGEVKVQIKLTNLADELTARENKIERSQVRALELEAVIDTGAVTMSLPSRVVERLGLRRTGKYVAQYADGRLEEVDVTEPVFIEIMGRITSEEAMVLGDEILVGQTILEKTDLLVDCREQRLIPNPAHPNQPVMKVR